MNAWAIRYTTRHGLAAPRGTRARGWYVGWRLACQLADRRWRAVYRRERRSTRNTTTDSSSTTNPNKKEQ